MREFYRQMLGAEPVDTECADTWAAFEAGGVRVELHRIPDEYARSIEISTPVRARESSPVKLIFGVENVPAERARLEALGIAVLQRPWQNADQEFDGVDPEGNVFRVENMSSTGSSPQSSSQ